ncbi:hypothetical protein BGZ91_003496, partial [Linnemannia elongata]
EKIVEHSEHGTWKALIEDTEDKLVAWEHRTIKGNLCRELDRLDQKHKDARRDKSVKTVLYILGFYFYRRCFRGEHTLEVDSVNASLVERAFGRIKIIDHSAVTVVDEPFVFKAVENYFTATDPGFQTALKELMDRTDAAAQGNIFERYMMTVFSETFQNDPCDDVDGGIYGRTCRPPFDSKQQACRSVLLPQHKPSGPDMVFFIRIDGHKLVPVFVQTKLHQSSARLYKKGWDEALATVSASCIRDHAKDFPKFCPDNIYISLVVAYPMKCSSSLPPVKAPMVDASGVQQVMIRVSDTNFGQIFPKEHVKFLTGSRTPENEQPTMLTVMMKAVLKS